MVGRPRQGTAKTGTKPATRPAAFCGGPRLRVQPMEAHLFSKSRRPSCGEPDASDERPSLDGGDSCLEALRQPSAAVPPRQRRCNHPSARSMKPSRIARTLDDRQGPSADPLQCLFQLGAGDDLGEAVTGDSPLGRAPRGRRGRGPERRGRLALPVVPGAGSIASDGPCVLRTGTPEEPAPLRRVVGQAGVALTPASAVQRRRIEPAGSSSDRHDIKTPSGVSKP